MTFNTRYYGVIFLLLISVFAKAQRNVTISGYIRDSLSKETLIGASLNVKGQNKGVSTNSYGFFSLSLPQGKVQLNVSSIGYIPVELTLDLISDLEINFSLFPKASLSQEIVITSRKKDANVRNAQMGKLDLSMNQIKSLPVIFGEVDPLKALQLMPGIRNAGEGNSGLYVRGGGPDQNLILLDDAVVYNPGHLFGFFSVFNGDALKNVSLTKGGMPAQYGGRVSSVLDIAMKEGNMQKTQVDGGIGTVASRLSIQGPVQAEKSSYMLSGRRTYIDMLARPFVSRESSFFGSGYYFYDVNA
ncbi:MAG: carboxypeptidase-like regulatory domain-containing protein, partial [Sphingobacteriales bacterium]